MQGQVAPPLALTHSAPSQPAGLNTPPAIPKGSLGCFFVCFPPRAHRQYQSHTTPHKTHLAQRPPPEISGKKGEEEEEKDIIST